MNRISTMVVVALSLSVAVLTVSSCAGTGVSVTPVTETLQYDPAWYPLGEGDVWVFQATRSFGADPMTNTRVKTVTQSSRVPGTMEQLDPEADSYYFTSDADGWRMHGDFKMAEPEHGKVYSPPMAYLNAEVFSRGETSGVHRVTVNGQDTGTELHSKATLIGWETISVPAFAEPVKSLKTSFQFELKGSHVFYIENWLVHGVGAVKRTMKVTGADGKERFTAEFELVAGRVGGRILPESNPDSLAVFLFRKAWENRERFPASFTGLSGACDIEIDGKSVGSADVVVSATGRVSLTPTGNATSEDINVAMPVLAMQFSHRKARVFDEQHGSHKFSIGDFDAQGIPVEVAGDTMGSQYEVSNHHVRVVSRIGGDTRFDVVVDELTWKRRRYMPTKFHVVYRDASGKEAYRHHYTVEYQQVGTLWIPSLLTHHDGSKLLSIKLRDFQPSAGG